MATFAPDIPEVQDPVYFHWSRAAAEPPPNRASAEAIKGAGESIASAFKVTDELVQQGIRKSVYSDVDPLTQRYATDLEQEKQSLIQQGNKPPEPALSTLKDSASTLVSARANNKMSETQYRGSIDTLAKDYRSRFPGYRSEIDQIFQEATGSRSTANQYIQSLVGDINALSAAKDKFGDKIENYLLTHMQDLGPEGSTILEMVHNKQMSGYEALSRANVRIQAKADLDLAHLNLQVGNLARKTQQELAGQAFSKYAAVEINGALDHIMFHLAGGGDVQLSKFLAGVANGSIKFTDQDIANAQTALTAYRFQVKQHLESIADKLPMVTGDPEQIRKTLRELAGQEEINSQTEKSLKAFFDPVQEAFSDKDGIGLGAHIKRTNEAIGQDAAHVILNDDTVGFPARVIRGATIAAGQQASTEMIQTLIGSKGVPPTMSDTAMQLFKARIMSSEVHGPPDPDNPGENKPDSLKTIAHTLSSPPPALKKFVPDKAKAVKDVIDFMDNLHNPKLGDEAKITMAQKAFNPENIGMVSMFKDGFYKEKGQIKSTPDSYYVFNTLTSKPNLAEVYRLDQAQPGLHLWKDAKDWAEHSFGSELYATEIQNLSTFDTNPGVKIKWNSKTLEFKAEGSLEELNKRPDKANLGLVESPAIVADRINRRLRLLNGAIKQMANLAEVEGHDPAEYVTGLIAQVEHTGVIAKKMRTSVIASRPDLVSKYTDDELGNIGELQTFINNPGRGLPGMKLNAPATSGEDLNDIPGEERVLSIGGDIHPPPGVDVDEWLRERGRQSRK